MKNFIKPFLIFCVLFLPLLVEAQWKSDPGPKDIFVTYHLKFKPTGKVLKFYVDNLTLYTDTNSLFKAFKTFRNKNKDYSAYISRIKSLVRKRIKENKTDTITFTGKWIPFEDSLPVVSKSDLTTFNKYWYTKWVILILTKSGNVEMYDKHNQQVTVIKTDVYDKEEREGRHNEILYLNSKTNEELFREPIDFAGWFEFLNDPSR